jgi:hypothetical protein
MTTEEFWGKYINEDIMEIFDDSCTFFSKELPQEFIDNYDVGEVILETKGHQETAKNFDNVLKFTDILQNSQPQLYKENFQYFNDFLIDYFCFHQDMPKVKKAFSLFIENPLQDYDAYLLGFKKILFYQHSELLEQAIAENFATVNESDKLVGNAAYDLAIVKFYMSLQEVFTTGKENIDKSSFLSKLSAYNFNFNETFLSSLETGLLKSQFDLDKVRDLLKKDKKNATFILQGYFLRYMHGKGFEFYLSGKIWDAIHGYWQLNNNSKKTTDSFFTIQTELFEKYLAGYSSDMFLDNKPEMIAILWGSVYVFEFLYKHNIISEELFYSFIETSRKLKGKVIGQFTSYLWKSNFVHGWEKPDCISETEFLEENKIFLKSIFFNFEKFTRLRSSISEELSKIGDLSHFIIEGGKDEPKNNKRRFSDDLFKFPEHPPEFENHSTKHEPIRAEKKAGRNEPCPCGSGKKYKKCCG